MSYLKKHKEGLFLTILFHLILLFIVLRFGFFTPLPLPDEKGVLVDFGTSAQGMGLSEPAPRQSTPVQQIQPVDEHIPPQTSPPEISATKPTQSVAKEEVLTQDYEKTVALETKKKEEAKRKTEEESERKRLEEETRLIRIADERRRRDSLQRIEDARQTELRRITEIHRRDSIKKAEEDTQRARIDSRAKNAFGSSGQNSNNQSTGQGTTYQPGNQGSTDGTPGANRYGEGGGEGITFNLTGRSVLHLPKPNYPGNEEGEVVVEVTVDKFGKVTKATAGVKGSKTLDSDLLKAAEQAALRTRFNENAEAPAFQTGTITYRFVLD